MSRRATTMPIQAGQLRRKLRIERATETQDAYGQPLQTWTTYRPVYGAVRPVSASERFRAAQVEETITHRITTRYIAGVSSKMRLVDDTPEARQYEVKGVLDPDARRAALVWECVEGGV